MWKKLMIDFFHRPGILCGGQGNFVLNQEFLDAVKAKMREYVERKIPIMSAAYPRTMPLSFLRSWGCMTRPGCSGTRMVSRG